MSCESQVLVAVMIWSHPVESSVYTRFDTGEEMLFDHEKDPDEKQNMVDIPEYRAPLKDMQQLLNQRIQESLN